MGSKFVYPENLVKLISSDKGFIDQVFLLERKSKIKCPKLKDESYRLPGCIEIVLCEMGEPVGRDKIIEIFNLDIKKLSETRALIHNSMPEEIKIDIQKIIKELSIPEIYNEKIHNQLKENLKLKKYQGSEIIAGLAAILMVVGSLEDIKIDKNLLNSYFPSFNKIFKFDLKRKGTLQKKKREFKKPVEKNNENDPNFELMKAEKKENYYNLENYYNWKSKIIKKITNMAK